MNYTKILKERQSEVYDANEAKKSAQKRRLESLQGFVFLIDFESRSTFDGPGGVGVRCRISKVTTNSIKGGRPKHLVFSPIHGDTWREFKMPPPCFHEDGWFNQYGTKWRFSSGLDSDGWPIPAT